MSSSHTHLDSTIPHHFGFLMAMKITFKIRPYFLSDFKGGGFMFGRKNDCSPLRKKSSPNFGSKMKLRCLAMGNSMRLYIALV